MVKDEERNMRRCLDSVKQLIETGTAELIIIDTGSSDSTPDIAREYTDKLYFHKWNNNFSDMRNISISYAKGEWIFIIDADEKLENPELLLEILKQEQLIHFNTVYIQVKNLVRIKKENQFTINISPRLFRNDGNFRYEGAVHNQPLLKNPSINTEVLLVHYGYDHSDKVLMEKKFIRTSEILKSELNKNSDNLYYIYQLATSYDMHGDKIPALDEFRKAYSIFKTLDDKNKYLYVYILGSYARVALNNGILNEALNICKEAIEIRSDYVDMYYLAGTIECKLDNEEKGLKYFLEFVKLIDKFNNLKISKDPTISIYHADPKSISDVYAQIVRINIKNKDYKSAYKYCKLIIIKETQSFLAGKILICLKEYEEIVKYYYSINNAKCSDLFISGIEEEFIKLEENEKYLLSKELSNLKNAYGMLNLIRISKHDEQISLISDFLSKNELNNLPYYYNEIYKIISYDKGFIFNCFKTLSIGKTRNIVKYLLESDNNYVNIFKEYLNTAIIRPNDLSKNKIYIAVAAIILVEETSSAEDISEENYNIFKLYIQRGINFVSQLYQIEKARIIYMDINSNEDKFFVLMYLVYESLNRNNIKMAVKYFSEAIKTFNFMVKYMDKLNKEIFNYDIEGE